MTAHANALDPEPGRDPEPDRGRDPEPDRGRVVIGGAGGFMGRYLADRSRGEGREVVTIGRSGSDLRWGDERGIAAAVDGAALVVGLAGKSVNCRYTPANRAEIFRSRLETTAELSRAIARAAAPPPLWVNAATATVYRHAEDRPMTERDGEIGAGFSVDVAKTWERALFRDELPGTRRVALRSAIVLGHGGVLGPLRRLARLGLGGPQHDGPWPVSRARRAAGTAHARGAGRGRQRFSWVHIEDVARVIDFLERHPELDGPIMRAPRTPSTIGSSWRRCDACSACDSGPRRPAGRWRSARSGSARRPSSYSRAGGCCRSDSRRPASSSPTPSSSRRFARRSTARGAEGPPAASLPGRAVPFPFLLERRISHADPRARMRNPPLGAEPRRSARTSSRHARNAPEARPQRTRLPSLDRVGDGSLAGRRGYSALNTCRSSSAVSLGVLPTFTPAASRASFFAWAVPAEPDTMAPAWPIVLPSGAVKPAT